MSTNIPSKWEYDAHRIKVNELVTENACFSALTCLLDYRIATEGITKTCLADRLNKDKGTVTKLTSAPSNMKIRTIDYVSDALNAYAVLIFVARENSSLIFTPTGIRHCGVEQVMVSEARPIEHYSRSRVNSIIEQVDFAYA